MIPEDWRLTEGEMHEAYKTMPSNPRWKLYIHEDHGLISEAAALKAARMCAKAMIRIADEQMLDFASGDEDMTGEMEEAARRITESLRAKLRELEMEKNDE